MSCRKTDWISETPGMRKREMMFWETDDFRAVLAEVDALFSLPGLPDGFLSPEERETLGHISHAAYAGESAAARILAKTLWACETESVRSPEEFLAEPRRWMSWAETRTVFSRTPSGKRMKPVLAEAGRVLPACFSLTHSSGTAAAVMLKTAAGNAAKRSDRIAPNTISDHGTAFDFRETVGCDLVKPGAVTAGMRDMFFSPREIRWMEHSEIPHPAEKIWAGKEAAYKASANNGHQSFAPAKFEITESDSGELTAARIAQTPSFRLHMLTDEPMIFVVAVPLESAHK